MLNEGLTLFRWKRVLLLSFGFLELRLVEGGYFGNVGLICHYEKLQGEREDTFNKSHSL